MFQQVCREWEATALGVNKDVRVALIRIGVVLGKDGGALGMACTYTTHKVSLNRSNHSSGINTQCRIYNVSLHELKVK